MQSHLDTWTHANKPHVVRFSVQLVKKDAHSQSFCDV